MNWYLKVLKNFTDFQGRARRKEYWMFVLFHIIVLVILSSIDMLLGFDMEGGYGILTGLYSLLMIIPSLAVGVRRLHDTGRSGWWILVGFIPIVGWIILIIFLVLDSQEGSNKWGENPKLITETQV
ncbi:MAG: DUF805 domain-containing protein [Vicingaceae bacterium]